MVLLIFVMTTLEYYWADGTHTTLGEYTIDNNGIVANGTKGHTMSQYKNKSGYNNVSVRYKGKQYNIRVARALASTFIGPPPTNHHTAEHKDRNRGNDVVSNIIWEDKSGQVKNRDMPSELKSAFIIEKNGVEHTAKEWVEMIKKQNGEKYSKDTITQYAQQQKHGFRYKTFPKLHGEVWKSVQGSKNKNGEWLISSKSRVKYKTIHTENVLTAGQLTKQEGYPTIKINGKQQYCHEISFKTFRPNEYVAKLPGDIVLHKNDDRLDFNPFRLRWGTPPENGIDAQKNGKHDGTKTAQKPIVSYIDSVFEKEHISIRAAARYLKDIGYTAASDGTVHYALNNDVVRYGRTWVYT